MSTPPTLAFRRGGAVGCGQIHPDVNALLEARAGLFRCRFPTPRARRVLEFYGRHYYFVERVANSSARSPRHVPRTRRSARDLYGTSRTTVARALEQGRDVLLEIDWQGARQIRKSKPDCVSVFILPPRAGARAPFARARLRQRSDDRAPAADAHADIAHAQSSTMSSSMTLLRRRWPDRDIVASRRDGCALAAQDHPGTAGVIAELDLIRAPPCLSRGAGLG